MDCNASGVYGHACNMHSSAGGLQAVSGGMVCVTSTGFASGRLLASKMFIVPNPPVWAFLGDKMHDIPDSAFGELYDFPTPPGMLVYMHIRTYIHTYLVAVLMYPGYYSNMM